jgi:hypothetical protein
MRDGFVVPISNPFDRLYLYAIHFIMSSLAAFGTVSIWVIMPRNSRYYGNSVLGVGISTEECELVSWLGVLPSSGFGVCPESTSALARTPPKAQVNPFLWTILEKSWFISMTSVASLNISSISKHWVLAVVYINGFRCNFMEFWSDVDEVVSLLMCYLSHWAYTL